MLPRLAKERPVDVRGVGEDVNVRVPLVGLFVVGDLDDSESMRDVFLPESMLSQFSEIVSQGLKLLCEGSVGVADRERYELPRVSADLSKCLSQSLHDGFLDTSSAHGTESQLTGSRTEHESVGVLVEVHVASASTFVESVADRLFRFQCRQDGQPQVTLGLHAQEPKALLPVVLVIVGSACTVDLMQSLYGNIPVTKAIKRGGRRKRRLSVDPGHVSRGLEFFGWAVDPGR